jgi:Tfp pilus assembly protein PilN
VVALLVVGALFLTQRTTANALDEELNRVQQEERRYKNLIRQKMVAGALRDSLVAELEAIREIDADRFVWPHILDEITKALPDYTWLTGIQALTPTAAVAAEADTTVEPPLQINIEGQTSDISAMTRFVRNLQLSPWIASVTIGPNTQVPVEGQVVTAFNVTAEFQTADSAYIRAVGRGDATLAKRPSAAARFPDLPGPRGHRCVLVLPVEPESGRSGRGPDGD